MLYTTYRPKTLSQVVGQEETILTLKEQIKANHFDSAYLFAGHRGSGKTTIARILARTICCENPNENGPCNICKNCKSIMENGSLDCIELDAASNNSISDIKELINSTLYLPSVLKKKIYIIDEVHNLSTAAFDALLKTIEEPPEYCVFILCTTELHKIPATIRSRCSIYQFIALSVKTIHDRLVYVLNKIGKEYDDEAVNMIAKQSDGSMRDALSITEKLIISCNRLTEEHVKRSLCLIDDEITLCIIKYLINSDSKQAISLLQQIYEEGRNLSQLVDNIIQGITDGIILFTSDNKAEIYQSDEYREKLYEYVKNSSLELLFWFIDQLSILREQIRNSMNPYMDVILYIMKCCNPKLLDDSKNMLLSRISHLENKILELQTNMQKDSLNESVILQDTDSHVIEKKVEVNENNIEEEDQWQPCNNDTFSPFEESSINESENTYELIDQSEDGDGHEEEIDDDALIEAQLDLFRDYL